MDQQSHWDSASIGKVDKRSGFPPGVLGDKMGIGDARQRWQQVQEMGGTRRVRGWQLEQRSR